MDEAPPSAGFDDARRVDLPSAAAFGLTRVISNMLYHVSATDPVTFASIAILFLAVAVAASCIPAWRASRVDPVVALRLG